MLAEYCAIDAMEPLPQETVGRELDMEAAALQARSEGFNLERKAERG